MTVRPESRQASTTFGVLRRRGVTRRRAPKGQRRVPLRSLRLGLRVLMAVAMAMLFSTPSPAATVRMPTISFAQRSVTIAAGQQLIVALRLSSALPSGVTSTVRGLPTSMTANLTCTSTRSCGLLLRARPDAPSAVALVELVLSRSGIQRRAVLAVAVRAAPAANGGLPGNAVPSQPSPTPTTTPLRLFALQADPLTRTLAPGATGQFSIRLTRANWSGPIEVTTDGAPAGWTASAAPNPTTEWTTLYVIPPAGAVSGDYPIRVIARSSSSREETTVVVRVARPTVLLSVLSPSRVATGGSSTFIVDARALDGTVTSLTQLSIEGLPAGVTATFAANPTVGPTTVTLQATSAVQVGTYPVTLVGRSGVTESRVSFFLTVDPPSGLPAVRIPVTPVTPVPGQPLGYGLTATPPAFSISRGGVASFDLAILPTGGFSAPVDAAVDVPFGWAVSITLIGPNVARVTLTAPTFAVTGPTAIAVRTVSGSLAAAVTPVATVV